jgi:uncharacterized membrane protein YqhA
MGKFLAGTRYLALIGVLALLAAALAAFGWGIAKTVEALALVITSLGRDPVIIIALIEIVDAFLVAMALLLFSVSIYELFIGELSVPAWMKIDDLHDLKTRLGSILVLVMAVKFLEKLAEWKDAQETLYFALSITLVSAVLIAFGIFRDKE